MVRPAVTYKLPSSPLWITEELVHRDLKSWTEDLLTYFDSSPDVLSSNKAQTCAGLNQSALIASLQGEWQLAYNLCQAQMQWLLQQTPVSKMSARDLRLILQPWINLGRLTYLKGDYEEARPHFDMIERIYAGWDLDFGLFQLNNEQAKGFLKEGEEGASLERYLLINYIDGFLKMFLKSQNYVKGVAFIRAQKNRLERGLSDLMVESELLLQEHLGTYKSALRVAMDWKPKDALSKMTFIYHLGLICHLYRQEEKAHKYISRLVRYLHKAMNPVNFIKLKRLTLATAYLCSDMGMHSESTSLFTLGQGISHDQNDQRYEILFTLGLDESLEKPSHELMDKAADSAYIFHSLHFQMPERLQTHQTRLKDLHEVVLHRFAS
ncbi:MAG: hypothetical protein AAFP89_09180 [Bacteroidota bacterium]